MFAADEETTMEREEKMAQVGSCVIPLPPLSPATMPPPPCRQLMPPSCTMPQALFLYSSMFISVDSEQEHVCVMGRSRVT